MKNSKRFALLMLLAALTCGCGWGQEKRVQVKGKLTLDGAPLIAPEMIGKVQLTFYLIAPDGKLSDPQEAIVNKDGTFSVPGTDGQGVKPGRYRISVRQWKSFGQEDLLSGKYGPDNSPIVRDLVDSGNLELELSE